MRTESLSRKLLWLWRHPASDGPATLGRSAAWIVRCAIGRGAIVPFGEGQRFYCPPEMRGIARLTYVFGEQWEPEWALLDRFVQPRATVVDVGAHYGSYALRLAQLVTGAGTVLAIEPSSHAVRILSRNLALNALRNVRIEQVAVGDRAGAGSLFLHDDPSRAGLLRAPGARGGVESIRIVRLDDLVTTRVSFIKIDVEGAELQALRGAERVLSAYRPVVQFEFQPEAARAAGMDPGEVLGILARHGYTVHRHVPGGLERVEAIPDGLVRAA